MHKQAIDDPAFPVTPTGPVMVLGMHRSGTSFATRAFNLLGLWLGRDDTLATVEGRAVSGNPKGNYESRMVQELNDEILHSSGGAWNRVPNQVNVGRRQLEAMGICMTSIESDKPQDFPRWGWKDPRTVITLDAWASVRAPICLVCMFRHPRLVAASLHRRNKMPYEEAFHLWYLYNARLLEHMEKYPSILLRFDVDSSELLENILLAGKKIGLHSTSTPMKGWYDERLVRSRIDKGQPATPDTVQEIWERLRISYEDQDLAG